MPSKIAERRRVAQSVSLESRIEAIEERLDAIEAEIVGRKPAYKVPASAAAVKARIAAAKERGN